MNIDNKSNDYAKVLGPIFDECPKTVIAAVAMSHFINSAGYPDPVAAFAEEWKVLHENGIVPQKPGRFARAAIAQAAKQ